MSAVDPTAVPRRSQVEALEGEGETLVYSAVRDAGGTLFVSVNGGAVAIQGGTPTVANTNSIFMNGVGGDNFWLIYDATASRLTALCGAGRSARAASIEWYAARGVRERRRLPSRAAPPLRRSRRAPDAPRP